MMSPAMASLPFESLPHRPKSRSHIPSELPLVKAASPFVPRSERVQVESPITPRPNRPRYSSIASVAPSEVEEPEESNQPSPQVIRRARSPSNASASIYGDDEALQPPPSPALSARSTRSSRHMERGRRVSELQYAGDISREGSLRERRHSRHSVLTDDGDSLPSGAPREARSRYSVTSDHGAPDVVRYASSDTTHTPAGSAREKPRSRKPILLDDESFISPRTEREKARRPSSSRHSHRELRDEKEDISLLSPEIERGGKHKEHKERRHRSRSRDSRVQDVEGFDDAMSVASAKTDRSSRHRHREHKHREDKEQKEHKEHKEYKEHREHREHRHSRDEDDTASLYSNKSSRHRHRDSDAGSIQEHRLSLGDIPDDQQSNISSSSRRSSHHHRRHHSRSSRHEDDRAETRTPAIEDEAAAVSPTRDSSSHRHRRSSSREHRHRRTSTVAEDEPDTSSHRERRSSHHRSRSSVSARDVEEIEPLEKKSRYSRTPSHDIDYGPSRLAPLGIATSSQAPGQRRVGSTHAYNPDMLSTASRESRRRRPSISSIFERPEEERVTMPAPSRSRPPSALSDRARAPEDSSAYTVEKPQKKKVRDL
ncbi:hypothetical protein TWF569_011971 [Orbilia oligospora]|uniref:Uncharacterized protein n=1 Tax=Orbilia oligospora TaxID=2813651 RepID=A0A7C8J1K3_ORBOL|nr:hypothetical protein TWF102_010330 [Orbilia oligospora]KAF3097096.1 hypothetical protein TWF103_009624 [Orbilia oligospora]KAF3143687.1 hypothetical protein TWF569_011971 [Orbilia oligospora]